MIEKTAVLSECLKYRYVLSRKWSNTGGCVVFLMFNPSTADANVDDATIRKCMGFASRWGYGELVVLNIFAYRSRHPEVLRYIDDPVGPQNDKWISRELKKTSILVCAWGCESHTRSIIFIKERIHGLLATIRAQHPNLQLCCLGLTKGGMPRHPLMLAYITKLEDYKSDPLVSCCAVSIV